MKSCANSEDQLKDGQYQLHPHHVLHAVQPAVPLGQPLGGAQGAVGEGVAAAVPP